MKAAVLVLGLLCIIPVLLASADQLYIRPSEEDPCAGEPCYLLSHVLQNAIEYLTSNTLVILTHGNYFVIEDIHVVIINVHNLTLMGSNTGNTVVNCSKQFGIFALSTHFVISNLNFLNCTYTLPLLPGRLSVGVTVTVNSSNVTLINTSFNSSTGSSVVAVQSNFVISNVNFLNCTYTPLLPGTLSVGMTVIVISSNVTLNNTSFNSSTCSSVVAFSSNLIFLGRTAFKENHCVIGCGIFTLGCNIAFHGEVVFQNNKCVEGCSIVAVSNTNISFHKRVLFEGNEAALDGSGIYAIDNCGIIFLDTVVFQNNTCQFGCGIFALGNSNISFNSSAIFESNKAVNYGGGVMITHNSALKFNSSATFQSNQAAYGGAMYLHVDENAVLFLNSAEINIATNNASQSGGGIYIASSPSVTSLLLSSPTYTFNQAISEFDSVFDISLDLQGVDGTCFYHCMDEKDCPNFNFVDNQANVAGHMIYGDVHQCYIYSNDMNIPSILPIHNQSDIASDPTRVCFCVNAARNCSAEIQNKTVYPGESFTIPVVVVGDTLGITTGTVFTVLPSNASLAEAQTSQVLQFPSCTNLNYTVYSHPGSVKMQLVTNTQTLHEIPDTILNLYLDASEVTNISLKDFFYHRHISLRIYLNLELLPCPTGFKFQAETRTCTCNQVLQNHGIFNCNIDNETVHRPTPYWIRASINGSTTIHRQCPLSYCRPDNVPISISNPDEQCQFDHSGTLCGGCKANLSMVLGTSRCLPCANWWLFLIPLFALTGIILVFLLTVLNLTVSIGTINGLIFYANIIRANMAVFFPSTQSTTVIMPSVFIAWLNLDLGIEVCFYSGLDTYAKTWLQLVFPVYMWIMVAVIIISSHYSTMATKLIGNNSVQVLATLFLLSYAKLLQIIIAAFSFTELKTYNSEYPANFSVDHVWLYDGNVQYLNGKHIPLFMIAVVILVALSVPYTMVLIFTQCLQQQSKYRVLFWVRKLKPFFDAYTGPYKDKHRYWTGLLLLVRVGLFLLFSVIQNVINQPSLSLLAIVVVAVSLLIFQGMVGGVYKLIYLNFLESFFLLNLICFSCATFYTSLTDGNQAISIYITVGLAFVVFMVVVAHGTYKNLRDTQCIKSLMRKRHTHVVQLAVTEQGDDTQTQAQPTHSEVCIELREPCIEPCDYK